MAKRLLDLGNVRIRYGSASPLLSVPGLSVHEGEVAGLSGPNGCGKSSLLHCCLGWVPFDGDYLRVIGRSPKEWIYRGWPAVGGVGFLPQYNRNFSSLTVMENLRLASRDAAFDVERSELKPGFSRLRRLSNMFAGQISGGEKLLLGLAFVELQRPSFVLLDEPSAGADEERLETLREFVHRLTARGCGVLLVEQRLDVLVELSSARYNIETVDDAAKGESDGSDYRLVPESGTPLSQPTDKILRSGSGDIQ